MMILSYVGVKEKNKRDSNFRLFLFFCFFLHSFLLFISFLSDYSVKENLQV